MADRHENVRQLLQRLIDADVEFVVCGGVAARAHGLRKQINDLDVIYRRSPANYRRIVQALGPLNPRPRGVPLDVEVELTARVLKEGYSFLLSTSLGDCDLIAELTDIGLFAAAKRKSARVEALGIECECLTLDALITNIAASGRDKDLRLAARLTSLQKRLQKSKN